MKNYICMLSSLYLLLQPNSKIYSQAFSSSNLPIIKISTHGYNLNNAWNYVIVTMSVISNSPGNRNNVTDPPNNFVGDVEIKIQGSSTVIFPKKSFRITTLDAFHKNAAVELLGMPKNEDWVFK